jgi:hypothetical protein
MVRTRRFILGAALVLVALFAVSGCIYRYDYPSWGDGDFVQDNDLLSVVSPEGEDLFHPGDSVWIQWEGWIDADFVTVELYQSGGLVQEIANRASNTGQFEWSVPATFDAASEVSNEYQISVRARQGNHNPGELYVQALSEFFSIEPVSAGGLSDVTVAARDIVITMIDNGLEIDGDTVDVILNGEIVLDNHVLIEAPGTDLALALESGVNLLEIFAVNEGGISPNTAQLLISNVIDGESDQQWRLTTGETGSLVITAP